MPRAGSGGGSRDRPWMDEDDSGEFASDFGSDDSSSEEDESSPENKRMRTLNGGAASVSPPPEAASKSGKKGKAFGLQAPLVIQTPISAK